MKKVAIIFLFVFFIFSIPLDGKTDRNEVKFHSCVDGDTIKVEIDGEVRTIRFLAIDTPETKHPSKGEEPFGKTASKFTCTSVKKAKVLEIEYDPGSQKEDKYDRVLAWIYVDGSLLQKELIQKGYAKVEYIYGDYLYTEDLYKEEDQAKENKLGIWSDEEEFTFWEKILNYIQESIEKIIDKIIKELLKVINTIFE